jgi:hypothetical protein
VKNVPAIFVPIIREHYASLRELEEYYSFEDAINLLEIWAVQTCNEQKQHEKLQQRLKGL